MPTELRGPVYRIQTPRLIIRCYSPGDVFLLVEAISASLDHLRPWMPWAAEEPEPLDDKIDRLRSFRGKFDLGQDFVYGIFNLEETQAIIHALEKINGMDDIEFGEIKPVAEK